MNVKNILYILSLSLLSVFVWTGCIDDDLVKTSDVEEGVPITVTMNLAGTGSADVVVNTKASGSDLSEISDLVLFIFHGDGSFEDVVTNYHGITTLKVNSNEIKDDNHNYNVTFNTTSGTKKLLAVANVAEGGFWEKVIDLLTLAYQNKSSFDEVKKEIVSLREDLTDGTQPFHITASSQMFISGWNEGVVFATGNTVTDYGKYGDSDNMVAVKMYRGMANVIFKIAANLTANDGANGTFTPTSFRVYNIPTKSYLVNDKQEGNSYALTAGVEGVTYINTESENIATAQGGFYTFDFYMPENIQEPGKNASNSIYAERDKWTVEEEGTSVSGASPEDKKWTNAPQNSTFVVISGTYEGNATVDGNNGQSVTANVEYTIHLGDFSNTGSMNNYSVERNVSYTYNVKVLGVDKIIVEAKKEGEEQSGAEGSIYDRTNTEYSYSLDAHYEQVYLEYNLTNIASGISSGLTGEELDNAIANQLILIIQSEAMDYTHESTISEPYTTRNKRGTLSPYKIYADAVRGKTGTDAENAASAAKTDVLGGAGEGVEPTKGFDYKWIEFLPQSEQNTISAYPGISSWAMESLEGLQNEQFYASATGKPSINGDPNELIDVYDMIVEMGKAIKQIYNGTSPSSSKIKVVEEGSVYFARFTAFVNEYYYLYHPLTGMKVTSWSVMTNKIPREMIIAMSTDTSYDGNSSYSKIHSYISQLSMQTFYNDRATSLNAFGIETYNETPLTYFFGTPSSTVNLSIDDGRENQKVLIGASNRQPDWDTYIENASNGWLTSVGTDRTKHKLDGVVYANQSAYSACMSRNRDLNGNGKIDENEIRWYLASLNEYIRIGIGANAISSAAKLYTGDKTKLKDPDSDSYKDKLTGYPYNEISNGSLYYTSSGDDYRVFWAIEKGSYNNENTASSGSNPWYVKKPLPIRCIRNLPDASGSTAGRDISSIDGVKSDATFVSHPATADEPIVLEFRNRLVPSLYRQRTPDQLRRHNEDDDENSYYQGIYVAERFLDSNYKLGDIIGYVGRVNNYQNDGTVVNPCLGYDEKGYYNWRVPNLIEMTAMHAAGLLNSCSKDGTAICCTQFTKQDVRYGFARSSLIYCPGEIGKEGDIYYEYRIRCVRDVADGYGFTTPVGDVDGE